MPVIVAVNRFVSDSAAEINLLQNLCDKQGVKAVLSDGWAKGGDGVVKLAKEVIKLCTQAADFRYLYDDNLSLKEKISKIAREIYRAKEVDFSALAEEKLQKFTEKGYGKLPVCIAKTQNSISHDKKMLNAPQGYVLPVRDVSLSAGAGFVVVFAGDILDMPGLPKHPAAENVDVDENGKISGLF